MWGISWSFGNAAADIDRGQDDAVGLLVGNLLDRAFLVDGDLRVVARDAVHQDQALAAEVLRGVGRAGHRGAAAGDQEGIARYGVQRIQIIRIHAGQSLSFILDKSLRDFQRKIVFGFGHRLSPRRGNVNYGQSCIQNTNRWSDQSVVERQGPVKRKLDRAIKDNISD